jgi:hypothetical protein
VAAKLVFQFRSFCRFDIAINYLTDVRFHGGIADRIAARGVILRDLPYHSHHANG